MVKFIFATTALLAHNTLSKNLRLKTCEKVAKIGEVNNDCLQELAACEIEEYEAKLNVNTDPNFVPDSCQRIEIIKDYWSPPRLTICGTKFSLDNEVRICEDKLKQLIVSCHSSEDYYKDVICSELSIYNKELQNLPSINKINKRKKVWKAPLPCQALNYQGVSDNSENVATVEQNAVYETCLDAYVEVIPMEEECKNGDRDSCNELKFKMPLLANVVRKKLGITGSNGSQQWSSSSNSISVSSGGAAASASD